MYKGRNLAHLEHMSIFCDFVQAGLVFGLCDVITFFFNASLDPQMDIGETVLICAYHLSNTKRYAHALIIVMNLSATFRRRVIESADLIVNRPLTLYLNRALAYKEHIPTAYRAKFLPFSAFIQYIEDRISNGDFRPIKLYFDLRKRDPALPQIRICVACAKKRFITQQLKGYLCNEPCDLEKVEKPIELPTPEPKRRLIDVAVGPDDPRFNVGWVREGVPTPQTTPTVQPEVPEELTEEQQRQRLVQTLTQRQQPINPLDLIRFRLGFHF